MWTRTFCFSLVKSQIRKGHIVNVSWLTFIRDCVSVFSKGAGQITTSVAGCFKSSLALLKVDLVGPFDLSSKSSWRWGSVLRSLFTSFSCE